VWCERGFMRGKHDKDHSGGFSWKLSSEIFKKLTTSHQPLYNDACLVLVKL